MTDERPPEREKNPHAVALGRLGGVVRSDRKAAAVRENGKLGGRSAEDRPDGRER